MASARSIGGLPGCSSISSSDARGDDDIWVPFSLTVMVRNQHSGGLQDGLPRLGRTGTREVVAAVGELVQVDVLGQQLPVAVACPEPRRGGVVRSDHHGDRRGQPFRCRVIQDLGEIAVRRHVVVAVRGTDMLGAFRVQLTELGVAAVRAQPRGDLGVAASAELGDGGAPVRRGTEQLRAKEHPLAPWSRARSSRRAVSTAKAVPDE